MLLSSSRVSHYWKSYYQFVVPLQNVVPSHYVTWSSLKVFKSLAYNDLQYAEVSSSLKLLEFVLEISFWRMSLKICSLLLK